MVHVSDAVKHELKRVMIRTVVTDDAVITVTLFRDFELISINGLSNVLGNE